MNTPDFGTTLESIKHIGDMVDGKMVCRKDCPSITHRNTPDTEWEEIKDEIYTLLHEFHGECVKEPFDGEPLQRRARKNRYTDTIFNIFTVLLTSRDTYWKERVRKLEKSAELEKDWAVHDATSKLQ